MWAKVTIDWSIRRWIFRTESHLSRRNRDCARIFFSFLFHFLFSVFFLSLSLSIFFFFFFFFFFFRDFFFDCLVVFPFFSFSLFFVWISPSFSFPPPPVFSSLDSFSSFICSFLALLSMHVWTEQSFFRVHFIYRMMHDIFNTVSAWFYSAFEWNDYLLITINDK